MEQKTLSAEVRSGRGSGDAGRQRRAGRIPGIVYGHSEPVSISISGREFAKTFHTISESMIITLQIGDDARDVVIKDFVEDITTGSIEHIDFYEIERGKKLRTHVAVDLRGSSTGVRAGGVLEHMIHELEIECLPKDMPEHLVIDITSLDVGQSVHVRDLELPDGVRVLNNADQTIVAVATLRAEAAETDEEDEETVEE